MHKAVHAGHLEAASTQAGVACPAWLLPGRDMALALLEFDTDRVVTALINVLDRVRALWFHPAHTHAARSPFPAPVPGRSLGGRGVSLERRAVRPSPLAMPMAVPPSYCQACQAERPLVPTCGQPGRQAPVRGRKGVPTTPALREAEQRDAEAGPAEAPATINSPRHQPHRKGTQGHRDVSGFRSCRLCSAGFGCCSAAPARTEVPVRHTRLRPPSQRAERVRIGC